MSKNKPIIKKLKFEHFLLSKLRTLVGQDHEEFTETVTFGHFQWLTLDKNEKKRKSISSNKKRDATPVLAGWTLEHTCDGIPQGTDTVKPDFQFKAAIWDSFEESAIYSNPPCYPISNPRRHDF